MLDLKPFLSNNNAWLNAKEHQNGPVFSLVCDTEESDQPQDHMYIFFVPHMI